MALRIFLVLFGLISLLYGGYCFLNPDDLATMAFVSAVDSTGRIELQAMYGGLQMGFGAFALFGALRPDSAPTVLLAMVFQFGGLGTCRLLGALGASAFSSYTLGGIGFELGSTLVAFLLWRASLRSAMTSPATAR
jgi:hypothetical protein